MTSQTSRDERVVRLRRLDCCAVSDALDRLKLTGVSQGLTLQSGSRRIAGRVVTVKLGQGEPPAGPARHLGATAVEASGPENVIVVEQRSGVHAGSWGGLLTLAAQVRGVEGVISDGLVRDADEAIALDFPIYARGRTAVTARGRIVELGTQLPIIAGEVAVAPDDYVIADSSAVIFIKAAEADRVLDEAEQIAAKEADMARALLKGVPVGDVMGGAYERMLQD